MNSIQRRAFDVVVTCSLAGLGGMTLATVAVMAGYHVLAYVGAAVVCANAVLIAINLNTIVRNGL